MVMAAHFCIRCCISLVSLFVGFFFVFVFLFSVVFGPLTHAACLIGYDLTLDDLKKFRQLDSK